MSNKYVTFSMFETSANFELRAVTHIFLAEGYFAAKIYNQKINVYYGNNFMSNG